MSINVLLSLTALISAIIYFLLPKKDLLDPKATWFEKKLLVGLIVTLVILILCYLGDMFY